jgi:hypothetical protein
MFWNTSERLGVRIPDISSTIPGFHRDDPDYPDKATPKPSLHGEWAVAVFGCRSAMK